jgi:hypothetical protein
MSAIDNEKLEALLKDAAQRWFRAAETCRAIALQDDSRLPALPPPTLLVILTNELKFTMIGGANCWRPTAEAAHEAYVEMMKKFIETTREQIERRKTLIDEAYALLGEKP